MKEVPPDDLTDARKALSTVLGKRSVNSYSPMCNDEEDAAAARTVVFGKYRDSESAGYVDAVSLHFIIRINNTLC